MSNTTPVINEKEAIFVFENLPENIEQLQAMTEAKMESPFQTAALALCALCVYGKNPDEGAEMLNALRGPRPLSNYDKSFLNDRFRDNRGYIPFSYFAGSNPDNQYTPSQPYTVTVTADNHSFDEEGYARLYIASGGADSPRPIKLRYKDDGRWYLWEQYLTVDIRSPHTAGSW